MPKLFIPFVYQLKRNLSSLRISILRSFSFRMAGNKNNEAAAEEINLGDDFMKVEDAKDLLSREDSEDFSVIEEKGLVSPKQEEETIKKKYGGLLPKKPPLISNDKEHAFFDSADWALGKAEAQKSKGPLEALRPKLQPTPHQQARSISAYAPANDGEDTVDSDNVTPENNQQRPLDAGVEISKNKTENQIPQN